MVVSQFRLLQPCQAWESVQSKTSVWWFYPDLLNAENDSRQVWLSSAKLYKAEWSYCDSHCKFARGRMRKFHMAMKLLMNMFTTSNSTPRVETLSNYSQDRWRAYLGLVISWRQLMSSQRAFPISSKRWWVQPLKTLSIPWMTQAYIYGNLGPIIW